MTARPASRSFYLCRSCRYNQKIFIEGDISLKQEDYLERNNKIPLLLLPGTLCNEKLWEHQISYLADIASITVGDLTQNNTIEGMASNVLDKALNALHLQAYHWAEWLQLKL